MTELLVSFASLVAVVLLSRLLDALFSRPINRLARRMLEAWMTLLTLGEVSAKHIKEAAEDVRRDWRAGTWRAKIKLIRDTLRIPTQPMGDVPDVVDPEDHCDGDDLV